MPADTAVKHPHTPKAGWLPWIAFLVVPLAAVPLDFLDYIITAFAFDRPPPYVLENLAIFAFHTRFVGPAAWLICLSFYFVPIMERSSIFCWSVLSAYGFHGIFIVAKYIYIFTQ